MSPDPKRRRHHLVSAGYQRNFADGNRVAVLDVKTGRIKEDRKPVRDNWYIEDFLTVISPGGELDDTLEREFADHERVILNRVRDIEPFKTPSSQQRSALDLLVAIHLLRSVSFRERHAEVVDQWAAGDALKFADDPELKLRFRVETGREPRPGELEAMVAEQAAEIRQAPDRLAEGLRRGVPKIDHLLRQWSIQRVVIDPGLPGLVLADHPVLHGKREEGLFGFKDAGAVGDADTILVPIRRHLAACYCPSRLPDVTIRTKHGLNWINSLLLRGAVSEVICHPSDALSTASLIANLDRFPSREFNRTIIR